MSRKNDVKPLPVRPAAPTFDDIIDDVTNSTIDDFVFVSMVNDDNDDEEFVDASEDSVENQEILKVENRYNEVCNFLDLVDQLEEGNSNLRDVFENMASITQDIRGKIHQLKSKKIESEKDAL